MYFLTPDRPEGRWQYPYHRDDVRMVKDLGAKFIGRAIYRWGGESRLNDPDYWSRAKELETEMHEYDPEMILQGCLFEIVTRDVENVPVPKWVFDEFGEECEQRNFRYDDMLNLDGIFVDHWRTGSSVPDISRKETQMWFVYLAGSYIGLGVEALHLGQISLIGMNDPKLDNWAMTIGKIRDFAKRYSRRGWVLLDAHTPQFGMVKDGVSLIDFNSFPLRIKEVESAPFQGMLSRGHLDSLYGRSLGCVSPSGWECAHLPYLVEFDNFGRGAELGIADHKLHFVWGWDEISWLAIQPESYRNEWLKYAHRWLRDNDPDGHLEMPGMRVITCDNETDGSYRANTKSSDCPIGYSQEATIKSLWAE